MGIRFLCPNGHRLNVKSFLAGKRAICPQCGAKVLVPNAPESLAAEMSLRSGGIANPAAASAQFSGPNPHDTASPSIIIAVAESEVSAPPFAEGPAVAEPELPSVELSIPESVVKVPRAVIGIPEPVVSTSEEQYNLRRARIRRRQMTIAIVLLMLVIVLAVGLVWVLRRSVDQLTGEPAQPVSVNERATPLRVAATSNRSYQRLAN